MPSSHKKTTSPKKEKESSAQIIDIKPAFFDNFFRKKDNLRVNKKIKETKKIKTKKKEKKKLLWIKFWHNRKKRKKKLSFKLSLKKINIFKKRNKRISAKKKAPDFPCFQKINWEKVSYFSVWSSFLMMFLIIIFLLWQIVVLALINETNGHINKLAQLNQKLENQTSLLKRDFHLLQDHTLNLSERKQIMQDLRELDEIALETRYEVLAYQNDLSVNLWRGPYGFLSKTFVQARQLELLANRLNQKMTYLAFVGRVNSFQTKLAQKDFDLLQDKIILIKSRLQAASL